jgi:hypothetical protein
VAAEHDSARPIGDVSAKMAQGNILPQRPVQSIPFARDPTGATLREGWLL